MYTKLSTSVGGIRSGYCAHTDILVQVYMYICSQYVHTSICRTKYIYKIVTHASISEAMYYKIILISDKTYYRLGSWQKAT